MKVHIPSDFQRNSAINQFNIKGTLSYILCEKKTNWLLIQTELFCETWCCWQAWHMEYTHTQSYHYPVHVPPFCYKGTDDHKSLYFPVAHVAALVRAQEVCVS